MEEVVACFMVRYRQLLVSLRNVGVPVEIRNKYFTNRSHDRYHLR
jgi:hypothetical protein